MDVPLEIAFHNTPSSPSLEADIRKRVGKLERIYDRLTGCRVAVEARHQQHRTGNVYEVHIEMRVPRGGELVVTREPHRAKQRYANPDAHLHPRSLQGRREPAEAYKEQLRGEVKPHLPMFQGRVSHVIPGEDYGFVLTNDGRQLYFHRNSLMNADFEALKGGEPVHYTEIDGDTGPTANKVWIGPGEHLD